MLVGTAITGQSTRPPTTLGSAPSMPATTTMASAAAIRSRCRSRRCSPATPTSATRSVAVPIAWAVTSASRATGRSLVPADSTSTAPRVGLGRGPQRRDRVGDGHLPLPHLLQKLPHPDGVHRATLPPHLIAAAPLDDAPSVALSCPRRVAGPVV